MSDELDLRVLNIVAESLRLTEPSAAYIPLRALQGRFAAILKPLGIRDRNERLRIVSACVGRPVTKSFNELLGGEIKALMEEPDLAGIIEYIVSKKE